MQQITLSNIIRPFVNNNYTTGATTKAGLFLRAKTWLNIQEENRLMWLAISVLGGIGTVVPLTLLAIVFWANNSFALWVICMVINVPILILNLAAQPPKVTLPVLFSVWFIDAVIILYCATFYFFGL